MIKKLLLVLAFAALAILPAFAVLATPVTISSIACAAGTCTVTTASAHSVPANDPGFCILSSSVSADNVCATAATVPTSTTYTVASATMAACASSCGTSQPAAVFMIQSTQPQFGNQNVSVCVYNFVPAPLPITGATSACSAQFSGALQTEINTAIAAGVWVETVMTEHFSNSATASTVQQAFQALQFSRQLQLLSPALFTGKQCDVTGCN